ncbi:MAG TPA: hypothetical protein VIZ00_05100, partial [Streptosporangiaceae bacterium]
AAIPVTLVIAVMAAVLIAPQQRARTDAERKDDLRQVAAIVSQNEERGDAVLYQPWGTRVAGLAYPRPFARLANVGLAAAPIASATLTGVPATPAGLARRLRAAGPTIRRIWLVRWRRRLPPTPLVTEQLALLRGLRLIRTWDVKSIQLKLYAAAPRTGGPA